MRHRRVFLAALLLVACDTGAEHGAGHGGGSLEVFVGRAPVLHASAPVAHADANADADAHTKHAAEPEPEPEPEPEVQPPDAGITDGPDGAVGEEASDTEAAPEVEAEAAPEPEAAPEAAPEPEAAPAPAPGGKSEDDWAKLANVRFGSLKVDGGLEPDAVKAGVRAGAKDLRQCYAKGLVAAPELAGKLTVEFVIDKKGKVESAKVKSTTLSNPTVEACFTDIVGTWKFDAPADAKSVQVRQAFTLAL